MSKQTDLINIPDAITVDGSNVGIGESSPLGKLHIKNGDSGATVDVGADELVVENSTHAGITILSGQSYNGSIYFGDTGVNYDGFITYGQGTRSMAFGTAAGTRMTLDSSGRVGIGTSSPTELLTVGNTSTQYTRMQFYAATNGASTIHFGDGTSGADNYRGYLNYAHDSNSMQFATGGSERMRIDSSGNVGIGSTSSPMKLTVRNGSANSDIAKFTGDGTGAGLTISTASTTRSDDTVILKASDAFGEIAFVSDSTEVMRITKDNNLLVNKSSSGGNSTGFESRPTGDTLITRDGGRSLFLNRMSNAGETIVFAKDGNTVGKIDVAVDGFGMGSTATGIYFNDGDDAIIPAGSSGSFISSRDNAIDLGRTNARFDDIYATNGTIQTSDFNEKQDIASLTATEMLVGKRISALFNTFRWKDSVAEKGENARTHTGVIAQDVQAAFTAEGLDAGDYALFISSTWWETQTEVPAVEAVEAVDEVTETTTDEDGNEVVTVITEAVEAVEAKDAYTRTDTYDTEDEAPEGATSKTRMGIRYPELLSFVAAYNEQRFASIEARLTALEA